MLSKWYRPCYGNYGYYQVWSGGSFAKFLDGCRDSANEKQVTQALKIIFSAETAKCILINIFGKIMKYDIIAKGFLLLQHAVKNVEIKIPNWFVRLESTNVEIGKELSCGECG